MRIMYKEYGHREVIEVKRIYREYDYSLSKCLLIVEFNGYALKFNVPEHKIEELLKSALETGFANLINYELMARSYLYKENNYI